MEVFKLHELSVFAVCFAAGIVLGIIFDVFRAIRQCFRISDAVVAIQDMLFWLMACAVVYSAIYLSNSAELRWFELVGLLAGTGIYIPFMSRITVGFFCRMIHCTVRIILIISKPVIIPVRAVFGLCKYLAKCIQSLYRYILYNLHKVFLKTSHKIRFSRENICKKLFFTFLKR